MGSRLPIFTEVATAVDAAASAGDVQRPPRKKPWVARCRTRWPGAASLERGLARCGPCQPHGIGQRRIRIALPGPPVSIPCALFQSVVTCSTSLTAAGSGANCIA